LAKLFDELKRRNVIRVAVAYAVAAWLLLQVADLVLDNISAPGWVMQVFMLALALGFLLVLLFSWAFELTPDGLKREKNVDRDQSVTHYTARKLDRVTIALLVLVLLVVGAERMFPQTAPAPAPVEATVPDVVADRSIAVLAFDDLSPEGDQEYFAEGISEELLNVLAQIPDLKVAGRTSSFAFKGQKRDLREIGEILEVAHILEGSVRKSGDNIRVTAQLVKADDGFHLFSRNYDRKLDDIFKVQDEIAREISQALRSTILGTDSIEPAQPAVAEAYDHYLRARQWIHTRDKTLMGQAAELLDKAIAIDPDYAPAYVQKALVLLLLSDAPGTYGEIPEAEAKAASRPLIDKALALDPDLPEAHATLGLWYSQSDSTRDEATEALRRALKLNPNQADAGNWLSSQLAGSELHKESLSLLEAVVERDPLYKPAFNNLIFTYMQTREFDKASTLVSRVERITGNSPSVRLARGSLALMEGRLATAVEELGYAYEFNPSSSVASSSYGNALLFAGDYDGAAEVAYISEKLVALELAGRHDEAAAIYQSLKERELDAADFRAVGDWLLLQQRAADFVQLVEQSTGDHEDWIAAQVPEQQLYGATHFTNLSFALRQLDRNVEADRILARAAETLAEQARHGADNFFYWINVGEYAGLTGDVHRVLSSLQKAVDAGYVAFPGFYSAPLDAYRGDPRFIALENAVIQKAEEERRKLGMLAATADAS
jgi:TolB-like protein/Tfp pilus assembly protein PilF